ncbi:hypothetical protein [Paenibacillus glacialis]|uniref:Uncharacterized protein n=1 Tax=Paenibacillus glacialis TaxID=494026 RepID=A0A168I4G2_9BACL|nr:hypothetical protein [Paenibacillus glacialis]OAB38858.1 hypothetical protein PGLA_19585 [Paenibacillus glacialis]
MMYKAYNENNVRVTVSDEQLNEAFRQHGEELPIEIVIAMGASHNKMFVPRLHEALFHRTQRIRIKAMQSLLSLNNIESVSILREKEKGFSEEDFNASISEKAILQSVIIRLEHGPSGAEEAFFKGEIHPIVKTNLLYNYSSHMVFTSEDVQFIINALEAYVHKSEAWMQKMKKDDYEDVIIKGLEALWSASEESNFFSMLNKKFYEKLVELGSQILKMKIDSYAKEVISIFAKALSPQYAYAMLEPIMNGRAKGDVRKELEKSLLILQEKEQE